MKSTAFSPAGVLASACEPVLTDLECVVVSRRQYQVLQQEVQDFRDENARLDEEIKVLEKENRRRAITIVMLEKMIGDMHSCHLKLTAENERLKVSWWRKIGQRIAGGLACIRPEWTA